MEKIELTVGAIITLALVISGTYYISSGDNAYVCKSKDIVMICSKLSSGLGTRCYYEDTYKVCNEGWVKLELEYKLETEPINISTHNTKQIRCNQMECVPI